MTAAPRSAFPVRIRRTIQISISRTSITASILRLTKPPVVTWQRAPEELRLAEEESYEADDGVAGRAFEDLTEWTLICH